jgi:hypothetical protein
MTIHKTTATTGNLSAATVYTSQYTTQLHNDTDDNSDMHCAVAALATC